MPKNILIEISPVNPATNLNVTIRLSASAADANSNLLNGSFWTPCVTKTPVLSMNYFNDGQVQTINKTYGDFQFRINSELGNMAWSNYVFAGALARVFAGDFGAPWSSYVQVFEGSCGALSRDGQLASVPLAGREASLVKDFLTATYAGTGNAEGPSSLLGTLKPRAYGTCYNVDAVLIDPVYMIYQYHGYGATEDVLMVYENAFSVNAASSGTYADYAALKAATLTAGQWAKAPAVGMFRLGGSANGKITADIKGAKIGGTFSDKVSVIVPDLIKTSGINPAYVDATSFNIFSTLVWSLYQKEQSSVMEIASEAIKQCGGYLFTNNTGVFKVGDFFASKTAIALKADRSAVPLVRSYAQLTPAVANTKVKVGFDRCWSVNSDSEISGAILEIGADAAAATLAAASAQSAADAAAADAALALSEITSLVSDSVLDRADKAIVIREYERIVAEKSGINSTASGYSVTTENTAYNTAYTALSTYLASLSPAYNDTTQNTTIDATVFKAKFNDLYGARQTLLNTINTIAGTKATWSGVSGTGKPSDNADVTGSHIAAGVVGQGPWTTLTTPIDYVIGTYPNLIFNASFKLGFAGWSTGSGWYTSGGGGEGYYAFQNTNGTSVLLSRKIATYPGATFTLQASCFTAGLTGGTFNLDIEWWNNATIIGYSSRIVTNAGMNWSDYHLGVIAPATTTHAVVRAFTESAVLTSGQVVGVRRIKLAQASGPSVFTDDASNSAIYSNGVVIDALQPAETGANVTETRVAAAITGQTSWATYSAIAPTTIANRTSQLDNTTGYLFDLDRVTSRRITRLRRDDDTTNITEAGVITGLGVAAGIAGQGDLATANRASLAFGENSFSNSDLTVTTNGWEFICGNSLGSTNINFGRNMTGYFGKRNVAWSRLYASSGNLPNGTWVFGPCMKGFWNGEAANLRRYGLPVAAGDRVHFQGKIAIHGGTSVIMRVRFWNDAATLISESDVSSTIGNARAGGPTGAGGDPSSFATLSGYANVPAGAAYAAWGVVGTSTGDADIYLMICDPMLCTVPAGQTSTVPYSPGSGDRAADYTNENTAAAIVGQGALATKSQINLASGDVNAVGSIPPSIPDNSFSYTSTTNAITLTWPTFTIYRADGTTIAISSGSNAITGLSSGATYKVYPYVVDGGGSSGSVVFVSGGSGSPTNCFSSGGVASAAATMYARGNIPLGSFLIATTSSGSGGGGGGGSACPHPSETIGGIKASELRVGDFVPSPNGAVPIIHLERRPCSKWFKLYSNGELIAHVASDHRFYLATGTETKVQDIRLGDLLASSGDHVEITGMEIDRTFDHVVSLELYDPHTYYLGNKSLLSHNPKP